MGKKYRNLMSSITAPDNMRMAYARAARSKRRSWGFLEFREFSEVNLARLAEAMATGGYRPDAPRCFTVFEPKARLITAPSFRDRVAQHALCAVISPIFEAALLPRTFACRVGLGTHAAARRVQADLRHVGPGASFLKTDFSRYFPSIRRDVLHRLIRAKIGCSATLRLIEEIVPPDGLGLPIGALTSQLFANVYGGVVDRWLQCDRGEKAWSRYMDDIVVIGPDQAALRDLRLAMEAFSAERLGLHFSKWSIAAVSRGINFVGYRIWAGHKLLRRQSVTAAKRKIERYRKYGDAESLDRFVASWRGHAGHADSYNLIRSLGLGDTP